MSTYLGFPSYSNTCIEIEIYNIVSTDNQNEIECIRGKSISTKIAIVNALSQTFTCIVNSIDIQKNFILFVNLRESLQTLNSKSHNFVGLICFRMKLCTCTYISLVETFLDELCTCNLESEIFFHSFLIFSDI